MVARKGSAPPTSGCRPDVILFHHRAEIGCRGWNRTSIRAFKGRCPTIRRPGDELVEPEVVATAPYRIKSPVPVCCGLDSLKLVGAESAGLSAFRMSRERSAGELHSPMEMERVNGIAPLSRPWHGRILLLNHTRKNWCPQPVSHRQPDA